MSSIIPDLAAKQVWFLTGSQHLYGEEPCGRSPPNPNRSPGPSPVLRTSRSPSCGNRC